MWGRSVYLLACLSMTLAAAESFNFGNLKSYARVFKWDGFYANESNNELWSGLFRDCDKRVTFSCIQKNAYTYLDNVLVERDNITVFDGLVLTKNSLNYGTCGKRNEKEDAIEENLVDGSSKNECDDEANDEGGQTEGRKFTDDLETPLEEVTNALRRKTLKFLATKDYEIQLPEFFFEGATVKLSPREIDENGALVRVDFGQRGLESQGRIFKKIRKFIQNKLLMSFFALLLIIKLIKIKFMFVIPFLFGVGTAKKLFLKLLLFFIPAFAHIFKLCSSFYTSHATKYHHHHHQIAHHHHHVPVPVPVPTYYGHHHHPHEEDFDGYDYAHPHIQYRKDMEELKEWGIEPYDEPYEDITQNTALPVPGVLPAPIPGHVTRLMPSPGPVHPGAYGLAQYAANARPLAPYQEKQPATLSAHNLAYSAYLDESKYNRRVPGQQAGNTPSISPTKLLPAKAPALKHPYVAYPQQTARPAFHQGVQRISQPAAKSAIAPRKSHDDDYYGPIIERLEDIFGQLRFHEEPCRERLVCSMYKSPAVYSPHSNLVSNELSRDPQELKRGATESESSQKFHRYLAAARLGQDGGDCLRTYPCHINTE
ncbi:hypothetical protein KM043_006767 [Ampulex compressa]|nr:hypothetical protein KM043_006767 [Ampulex compressa]